MAERLINQFYLKLNKT